MNDLNSWEWNNSIENRIHVPHDFNQAAKEVCEKALRDAKRQLHRLLRNAGLDLLEQRGEFLQPFKSALERRSAQKLAAWHPDVQAIFQFNKTRIVDMEN